VTPSPWKRPLPAHIAAQLNPTPAATPQARERNAGHYGQAGFASIREVHATGLIPRSEADIHDGVYLGRFLDPYATPAPGDTMHKWFAKEAPARPGERQLALAYAGENNIVTIAPAGSGKGAAAIIPTLLSCTESMFVLDVKGENWFVTAPARQAMGHEVVLIDPFDIWGEDDQLAHHVPPSAQFNPLAHLRSDDKRFISQIESLTTAIIVAEGKEPHWTNRARQLLSCIIAHVCSDEFRQQGLNTLPYVREVLGFPDSKFAAWLASAYKSSTVSLVRDNAGSFILTIPGKPLPDGTPGDESYSISKEVGAIRSTAVGQLGFLNHDGIRYFLSGSSFRFEKLRTHPVTVFCMFPPDELDTYYRFARLMVQAFFNSLAKTPKQKDRRVLALLDEQAKLRHMEIIETSVALLRGYKVRIWSIFQDITQIKSIYGEAWETFISNAGVVQIMTPNGATTADYFSKRTGTETITETRVAVSAPPTRVQDPIVRGGTNTSENSFGVPFLSPQDLYAMPRGTALLFVQGMAFPVLTTREDYFRQKPDGFFYDRPYAPHPVHNQDAFAWMVAYLERFRAASP
jgi:type IV secretion system protein VirD4